MSHKWKITKFPSRIKKIPDIKPNAMQKAFAVSNCQFSVYKNKASFKIYSFLFLKFFIITSKLNTKKLPVESIRKRISRKNSLIKIRII